MIRPTPLLLFSVLACSHARPVRAPADEGAGACRAIVEAYSRKGEFTGEVLITRRGRELCRVSAGAELLGQPQAIGEQTVFPLASLSKPMIAVAVLRAVELRRLSIDDPVTALLGPDLAAPALEGVRISDLLDHTSGLADFTKNPEFAKRRDAPAAPAELWELARTRPRRFEPGAKFEYCNTNYLLLGLVLERVYGEPLETVVARDVFAPAQMRGAMINRPLPGQHAAVGSRVSADPDWALEAVPAVHLALYQAAGGIAATADDVERFARALLHGPLQAQWRQMRAAHPRHELGPGLRYGLGWIHGSAGGRDVLWHTGSLAGYSHRVMIVPDEDLVVIALGNVDDAPVGRPPHGAMGDALLDVALGRAVTPPPPTAVDVVPGDAPAAAELAGRYRDAAADVTFEVSSTAGRMYLEVVGPKGKVLSTRRRIDRAGVDRYVFPRLIEAEVRFERDAARAPSKLVFTQGKEVVVATREAAGQR